MLCVTPSRCGALMPVKLWKLTPLMFNHYIYAGSPRWLQEVIIAARETVRRSLREGKKFRHVLSDISSTQWMDKNELREYQAKNLVALVHHAAKTVPYYRKLFSEHGLNVNDVQSPEDLRSIPYLTKQDVTANPSSFISERYPGMKFRGSTSGTTGAPVTIMQDLNAIIRESAFLRRHLHWAGYREGQRLAWLRGDMIVPFAQSSPPFWRFNRPVNTLMMSSYHLAEPNAAAYLAALQTFDPAVIQAYPSSIAFLARFLDATASSYKGASLRAIITSSETLTDDQRQVVERRMGCKVYDHYGSLERVVLIGTCEVGNYHLESDYGYTELLPDNDGNLEIVGTGFNNWLMPLIRYRSHDQLVMGSDNITCACGRKLPLVDRIQGRMDDYILTTDGRRIGRLDHVFKGVTNIAEAQIVQDRVGAIKIVIVPMGSFNGQQECSLRANVADRLGKDMEVSIDLVAQIPRGRNGKLRGVICRVNA